MEFEMNVDKRHGKRSKRTKDVAFMATSYKEKL